LEIDEAMAAPAPEARPPAPTRRRALAYLGAGAVGAAAGGLAAWLAGRGVAPAPEAGGPPRWRGGLPMHAGGPTLGHRVSPDGTRLAFIALVKELGQVGVMDLASGEWRILTHSRDEGAVCSVCWAPDGGRIYYDRWIDSPGGVYSIPALGDEAR